LKYGDVVHYAILGEDSNLTGNATRFVNGAPLFKPAALAIVHFAMSQGGVYLYYCDNNWRVKAENWFYSSQDAMERSQYEFTNIEWNHI
jgi:hypothetical protein